MRSPSLFALVVVWVAGGLCLALAVRANPQVPEYRLIANPANQSTTVDRKFVQDAFLKKVTEWPRGGEIRPVDLAPSSPVRRRFTEDVLKRSVEAVRTYWQQRIFAGRDLPPAELDTDQEVIDFVLKRDGSIGYISGAADPKGAKILDVR